MPTDDLHQLSNDLVVLSARLVRRIRRHAQGMPAASLRLLSQVDELGPSTVGVLAEADQVSQPTMSGLVRGMVDRGWLERSPHPDDARAWLLSLTPDGAEALSEQRRHNADLIAERVLAAGRSTEDVAAAVRLLRDVLTT